MRDYGDEALKKLTKVEAQRDALLLAVRAIEAKMWRYGWNELPLTMDKRQILEQVHAAIAESPVLVCQYCQKKKPDVCERNDSYANDVNNDPDATHTACDQCDQDCRDDI